MYADYIRDSQIKFKYARGKSEMNGKEMHPYHEILYFVGENATFISEDGNISVKSGTLIIIPKGKFHQFNINNQDKYERYVINFYNMENQDTLISSVMNAVKVIENPNREIIDLFLRLHSAVHRQYSAAERIEFLHSAFVLLLLELKNLQQTEEKVVRTEKKTLVYMALEYISHNYQKGIGVGDVANALFVSKSLLAHKFRAELNISVYQYIIEKRLIYAHQLLSEGIRASDVCRQSGFNDYSVFFRAYIKMFDSSPSGKESQRKKHYEYENLPQS